MFPDKKPNIWTFIEKIKKLESSYSLEFETAEKLNLPFYNFTILHTFFVKEL